MRRTHSPAARLALNPVAAAVAALVGSSYLPQPAQAQEVIRIEEIVVTASRRETTVQELPFNIAAVSGAELEQQRLTSLTELSRWVPGFTVVEQGPRASSLMTVRGLNVRSLNAAEFLDNTSGGTVGTYLGEIPLYLDFKMYDLDRVEVLIGPQGTLYGEGTLGGAVRYIPAAPDSQEFDLAFHGDLYSLAHSSGTGYQADVMVNAPIIRDRLAFRGSFGYVEDPGFIDAPYLVREPGVSDPQPDLTDSAAVAANLYGENDVDWEETFSGRLALLWNAGEAVDVTFNYYFQDQDAGGRSVNHRDSFSTGNYESGFRFVEPNKRESELVSIEVVADLGFAELTSATGVSQYDQTGQRDQTDLLLAFDYTYDDFPSFVAFTRDVEAEERTNQEIRLVSTGTGPVSWLGGVFYNDYDGSSSSREFTPGYPEFIGQTFPTGDLEFQQDRTRMVTETAFFGEIGYAFTDRWQVTVGGRSFEYDFEQSSVVLLPLVDVVLESRDLVSDDGFLTKLNTSYDFRPGVMGYVTLSEGYRVGGANSAPPCVSVPPPPGAQSACALPDEITIDPDTTTNFEVGLHSTWNNGALIFNGAVYNIDWDKVQTAGLTTYGDLQITVNGGKARSQGIELALQSRGEHWSFTGSYAYNEAELASDAPGLVDGEDAFAGDRLAGTPEHQGSFFANYYRALPNGWDLDVGYGFNFTSDVLTKVGLHSNGETLGGYTVHHLSVGVSEDNWAATLYADNLTDKFAETAVRLDPSTIGSVSGFDVRSYYRNVLRPRSIGIEFRYRM